VTLLTRFGATDDQNCYRQQLMQYAKIHSSSCRVLKSTQQQHVTGQQDSIYCSFLCTSLCFLTGQQSFLAIRILQRVAAFFTANVD